MPPVGGKSSALIIEASIIIYLNFAGPCSNSHHLELAEVLYFKRFY